MKSHSHFKIFGPLTSVIVFALSLSGTLGGTLNWVETASASVVGKLSRMQVQNTTSITYRVFGQVEDFCTGTMIGPRLVLTAAHCVYDLETKTPTGARHFSPARTGNTKPFGEIEVVKTYVDAAYYAGDASRDVAVLVLKEPIGLKTGWLEIAWDVAVLPPHRSALGGRSGGGAITGYPGDKAQSTMWLVACDFYVPPIAPHTPQYTCDTFGGMSGSALIAGGPGGRSMIFGVHTTGRGHFNSGITLTGPNKTFVQGVLKNHPF